LSGKISFISIDRDPLGSSDGYQSGGQSPFVKELSSNLGDLGQDIHVYTRKDNDLLPDQEELSHGAKVLRVPIGPGRVVPEKRFIQYLKDIATWIPTFQIQHGLHYDLVHTHSYLSGPVGIHLKDTWGIPFIHSFYSLGLSEEELPGSSDPGSNTRHKIEKMICTQADRIIAMSDQDRIDLIEIYQANPEIVSVAPCGVNLETFQPLPQSDSRKEIAFTNDVFLITYVGELSEGQGLDTLLDAIYLLDNPDLQAVIVGGPPSEKPFLSRTELAQEPFLKYLNMIDDFGIERQITFTGSKPHNHLATYYSAGDISVVPSLYEPIGMGAMEALSCGSSVIASRTGGLISVVQENQVGALFEPGNSTQLAEKINLLYNQPKVNEELRKNARPYAEEHFTWKAAANTIAAVYQDVLDGNE
jgi:glycosyltransferase involved in cell wall biosynthesis